MCVVFVSAVEPVVALILMGVPYRQVIPPDGWREPKTDADLEKIYRRHNVKIGPIKQCVNGLRGVYQLGLVG